MTKTALMILPLLLSACAPAPVKVSTPADNKPVVRTVHSEEVSLYITCDDPVNFPSYYKVVFMFHVPSTDTYAVSEAVNIGMKMLYDAVGRNFHMKFLYKVVVNEKKGKGFIKVENWTFSLTLL